MISDVKEKKLHACQLAVLLVFLIIVVYLYYPAIFFDYVWDDLIWLSNLRTSDNIFDQAFLKPFLIGNVYWRPLAELSLYIQLGEAPERVQHFINICLHLVNIILLFLVSSRARTNKTIFHSICFLILIAFFALHPAFVEPVVWVSGRFDLLITTFFLLTLLVLFSGKETSQKILYVSILYLCSLWVKETALLFIPLIALFLLLKSKDRNPIGTINENKNLIVTLLLITFAYFLMRGWVLGGDDLEHTYKYLEPITLLKLQKILATIGGYLTLMIFPFKELSTLYPETKMLSTPFYTIVGMVYLLFAFGLIWCKKPIQNIGIIMLIFLGSLLLVINIIPVGFPTNLIQNRYLYPSVAMMVSGLFIGKVELKLSKAAKYTFCIFSLIWLLVAIANIRITLPLWKSLDSLSQWMVTENPGNIYATNMRATYLLKQGQVNAAIEMVGNVVVVDPTHGAYKILGDAHLMKGDCKSALVYYKYAYEFSEFPVHKVESLIGEYRIVRTYNPDKAKGIKEEAMEIISSNTIEKENAVRRFLIMDQEELVCYEI